MEKSVSLTGCNSSLQEKCLQVMIDQWMRNCLNECERGPREDALSNGLKGTQPSNAKLDYPSSLNCQIASACFTWRERKREDSFGGNDLRYIRH